MSETPSETSEEVDLDEGGFELPPALIAVLVLIGGFIAGAVLVALDFVLIGVIVGLAAVPVALISWVMAGERI